MKGFNLPDQDDMVAFFMFAAMAAFEPGEAVVEAGQACCGVLPGGG